MKKRFLIALIICVVLLVIPNLYIYKTYMREEHGDTCYKARLKICIDYTIQTNKKQEMSLSERKALLNKICKDNYGMYLDASEECNAGILQGVCRDGGVILIKIKEDSNRIETYCSIKDHEECIWN